MSRTVVLATLAAVAVAGALLLWWLRGASPAEIEICDAFEGEPPAWDRDGDRIPDILEEIESNLEHQLSVSRCDVDPSRPEGVYTHGSLINGLQLLPQGDGFIVVDPAIEWGTVPLLECVVRVGLELERTYRRRMWVRGISKREGGPLTGFESHHIGLEVAIRYLRSDRQDAPVDIVLDRTNYDAESTRRLFELFIAKCDVNTIMARLEAIGFSLPDEPEGKLQDYQWANENFHVVLTRPPDDSALPASGG